MMIQVRRNRTLLTLLFVAVYLLLVDYFYDIVTLAREFTGVSPSVLMIAIAGMMVSYLLRGMRVAVCFSLPHLLNALGVTVIHNAWNIWLPARAGEISFPILMRRYFHLDVPVSVYGLIWLRLLDLHTLLAIGLAVFLPRIDLYLAGLIGLAWLLIIPLVYQLLGYYLQRSQLAPPSGKIGKILVSAVRGIPLSPKRLLLLWLLSIANWAIKISVLALLLTTLFPVGLLPAAFSVAAGELFSVLPLHTPGSMGTYEAGMALGLGLFDLQLRDGFRVAIQVHVFLLVLGLLSGLLAYLLMKKSSADERHS